MTGLGMARGHALGLGMFPRAREHAYYALFRPISPIGRHLLSFWPIYLYHSKTIVKSLKTQGLALDFWFNLRVNECV